MTVRKVPAVIFITSCRERRAVDTHSLMTSYLGWYRELSPLMSHGHTEVGRLSGGHIRTECSVLGRCVTTRDYQELHSRHRGCAVWLGIVCFKLGN
ncbi:hypothetical protein RRG08_051864 [Elysia crispata]|uniref:Uncharacterized protein n=1 Tax=Elysia crispata TaxID=231223 RepID=A0AAE1DCT5_9GAST|nr:hypothetical protein RRG08_051864 [Elysia crispata]